jgi:hypothetical protein
MGRMARDGVDAELVFPSLGLMLPRITDRAGQATACRIWNDRAWDYTAPVRDKLIPAAVIPCIDFGDALTECRRTDAKGYAAFCLWKTWGITTIRAGTRSLPLPAISPKLSRLPSQIVRDQVNRALQNDTGSIATRRGVGIGALLFATDYPHSEGTFPLSKTVVDRRMAEHPDCTMDEFVAVLGGNAAYLFSRANLKAQVEARHLELMEAA